MNISALSIKNPVPSLLLFILLSVFGIVGFSRLQIQDFPDMELPTIKIGASLEGAAPAQLETEVARKIEDKLASLAKLDHIATTITDGAVNISVSFELGKNSEEALSEVRNAVDSVKGDLPAALTSPTVSKLTAGSSSLLTYTIASAQMDEIDLTWFVDNNITKAIQQVKGVSNVSRIGGVDREMQIELIPALMAGLGVTPTDVTRQLKSMQQDSSGGQGRIAGQRQSARTINAVTTPAEIGDISIPIGSGGSVRLAQIAKINDTHAERSSLAYYNNEPVIGFQITRSRGYSDLAVADEVRTAVKKFAQAHPEVSIHEASNKVEAIRDNYSGSLTLLLEGALLAIIVVWFFLRNMRATLISATALPLSIIPTFGVMYLLDYSLNTITLLSLSLVIGILVDDAIVEVENIERHLQMGKNPYQAAMEAADEIGLAVIATTFSLVAVFLPTAFMGGIPGKIFSQFGITVSVAILASLLVARLLTPMMAAYLLKPKTNPHEKADGKVMSHYLIGVQWMLEHRKTAIIAAIAFFSAALALIPFIPTSFMPAQDNAQTSVTIKLPPGSTLDNTAQVSKQANSLIKTLAEVQSVFISVGSASSGGGMDSSSNADVTNSTLTIDLVPRSARAKSQAQVEATIRQLLQDLPGVRVSVGGMGNGEKLELTLTSDDSNALNLAAKQAQEQIRTLKGLGNITSSAALQRPEIQITPNSAKAAQLGVTAEAISEAMRLATYGGFSSALPKLNLPQRQIALRVRMDTAIRQQISSIKQLQVQGTQGMVNLGSVAEIALGSGPAQIDRLDRARNETISIELNGKTLGEVQTQALALPALKHLPAGVQFVNQGEVQRMTELFSSFAMAMAIGVFCVYAVLVLLFHDFMQPATILCALPLAIGGALMALWVTNQSFSMAVVIGVLMLMGIVTKNSILLVDYAIMARRLGKQRLAAVIDACHKRARPIIMTTIAMAAGMLPNAIGLGAEPSFRQPMAIVVISGLLTSTCLSLLVVPVVFTYVDDLFQWLQRIYHKKH